MTTPPTLPEMYQGDVFLDDREVHFVGARIYAFHADYKSPSVPIEDGHYTGLLVQTIPLGSIVGFRMVFNDGRELEAMEGDIYDEGHIHRSDDPIDLHFVSLPVSFLTRIWNAVRAIGRWIWSKVLNQPVS